MTGGAGEWRRGWPLVLAAAIGTLVSTTHVHAFGVLLALIEDSQGWSRTVAASGIPIISLVTFFAAPVVGMAVDRFGPRRIALGGLAVYFLGLALLPLVGTSPWGWWALWGFVSLGANCIAITVWTAGVVSRFDANRGAALAFTLCGAAVAASALPLISGAFAEAYGWRGAVLGVVGLEAAIALPVVFLFFYGAKDRPADTLAAPRDPSALDQLSARHAILSWTFLKLATAAVTFAAGIVGSIFHFVPILEGAGIAKMTAAATASAIGICALAGRIVTGFMIDRLPAPLIGSVVFLIPVLSWAGIMTGQFGGAGPLLIAAGIGLAAGAELDLIAYLTTRYFGIRIFGLVFGAMSGLIILGSGLGPTLAAALYDRFHTYDQVGFVFIPLFVTGSVLLLTLGRYPATDEAARQTG